MTTSLMTISLSPQLLIGQEWWMVSRIEIRGEGKPRIHYNQLTSSGMSLDRSLIGNEINFPRD